MARDGWNEEDTYKVQDATSWGGFAGRPGDASNPSMASGAASDVNRYRGLGTLAAQRQAYQNDWSKADAYAGQAQGARGQQQDALSLQRQAAYGSAPSAAQILGRNMLDQSLQAQMAGAASARGGSLAQAAAMRGAAQQAGVMQQQGMNQLSALRAQEMAQARGEYMAGASGIRGQDFAAQGLAQQQQGMNLQSELAQRQLNQQAQMGYEQMGFNVNAAQQQAALQKAQLDQQQAQYEKTQAYNRREKNDDRAWSVVGSVIGGLGGFLSDENAKVPLGQLGAPVGYAASRAGQLGALSDAQSVPVLAPGSQDWARYGTPTEAEAKWAPQPAVAQAPAGARPQADPYQERASTGLKAFGSISDMTAKSPLTLSDMVGKVPMGYSDARAKMPSGVMGYEDGARIGPDGLGYVERPQEQSVVPSKFAAMQAAAEGRGGLASTPKPKKAPTVDLAKWADSQIAKTRAQTAAIDKTAPAANPMADAARAMQASAYAYKPGMEPPEQQPGEPNVGPMAQTMASNPVTATAIKQDPNSGLLMIDQGKMTKVLGGVVAAQQQQLDEQRAVLAQLAAKRGK